MDARGPRLLLASCVAGLALAGAAAAQPVNDACIARKVVTAIPYTDVESIAGATLEPDEHEPACTIGTFANSVWYDLVTPIDGLYRVDTCGSDFDTLVQIYDGPFCGDLTQNLGLCNDDSFLCGPGTHQSATLFRRDRQHSIHVQTGSVGPAAGSLRLSMALVGLATNDACSAARAIDHPVFLDVADTSRTSAEAVDRTFLSRCGGGADVDLGPTPHSVWYLYRAARAGTVLVDTSGTNTALAVAVFKETASGCGKLGARVACTTGQGLSFVAEAGQTYRLFAATPTDVAPDRLVLRLFGPNEPPVANAGPAQTVAPSVPVTLDASASRDPDGDPLVFAWVQRGGPPVPLSDPASPTPKFTAPATDGPLTFEVAVQDGAAVARATVVVTVSAAVDDPDHDGVGVAADECPNTPPGAAVDVNGCACGEAGHRSCALAAGRACITDACDPNTGRCVTPPASQGTPCLDDGNACTRDVCDGAGSCGHVPVSCATDACTTGACDEATGQCVGSPLAAGTRCADDGNACTDDVCDGAGTCTHPAAGSFVGAACQVSDIMNAVLRGPTLPARDAIRLVHLLTAGRGGIAVAEAASAAGNARVARQRLLRSLRAFAQFSRLVRRLEARRKMPPSFSGQLLDATQDVLARVTTLRTADARAPSPTP